jgi:rhodanese-related sulfurtransferase
MTSSLFMMNPMTSSSPQSISARDLYEWLSSGSALQLIDVREHSELEIAPFPGLVEHLPLSESNLWLSDLPARLTTSKPIVVICHAGIRSRNFGCWLLDQGPDYDVWNLEGGIHAWSVEVDPSVPRY